MSGSRYIFDPESSLLRKRFSNHPPKCTKNVKFYEKLTRKVLRVKLTYKSGVFSVHTFCTKGISLVCYRWRRTCISNLHTMFYMFFTYPIYTPLRFESSFLTSLGKIYSCKDEHRITKCNAYMPGMSLKPLLNIMKPIQNCRHFADDIFTRIFLNGHFWFINKISLTYVLHNLIEKKPALVQMIAWLQRGASHYLKWWWHSLLTQICAVRPRWVKTHA